MSRRIYPKSESPEPEKEPDIIIKRKDVKKVEYDTENDMMIVYFYKGKM